MDDRGLRIARRASPGEAIARHAVTEVKVGRWQVGITWRENGGDSTVTIRRGELDRAAWLELCELATDLGRHVPGRVPEAEAKLAA